MSELFNTILYEPLFNLLVWIYDVLPWNDLGVAIIIITLLVRVILFYPSLKGLRSQKALQDVQPKLEEIRKKYANDKEELGRQMMRFYKENKVNPFSSCLPLLIQLPILLALFRVFLNGLATDPVTGLLTADQLQHLYEPLRTAYATTPIQHTFLGIMDLSATHNIVLAVLSGIAQFFQARMLSMKRPTVRTKGARDEDMAAAMNRQMVYIFPIITVVFGYQFPAGVTLYWLSSTVFTWIQQLIFLRERKKMNSGGGDAALSVPADDQSPTTSA